MSGLVNPHGGKKLKPLLLKGEKLAKAKKRAKKLKHVMITSREVGDLIMMGIGAFTPIEGFMTKADWKSVCLKMKMKNGVFWPIPITMSVSEEDAKEIKKGQEVALVSEETKELMGTIKVTDKYDPDESFECLHVFQTTHVDHPGVKAVMEQKPINLGGPVKVFSESYFPKEFKGLYMRPDETRKMFEKRGWSTVAALQLRNPMHRSHEYLAKLAIEVTDGLFIHQLVGKLKPGDIPADVRVEAINVLTEKYFVDGTVIMGGYPLDMRYAGPREALLHALFRQNFGCSHLIVGRDHAGVGEYYGPFDAHHIFDEIPKDALEIQPLKIDWTFYCEKCRQMASMKTCPHGKEDRILLSGTMLRKMLSEGDAVSEEFSRPEVLEILRKYYAELEEKVEIKLHKYAEGEK
ncbi:MAG: sulfate adenylyltransferase [Nitrospinota bacterium]